MDVQLVWKFYLMKIFQLILKIFQNMKLREIWKSKSKDFAMQFISYSLKYENDEVFEFTKFTPTLAINNYNIRLWLL